MKTLKTSIVKVCFFLAFLCPFFSIAQPINNTVHYYKDVKINLNVGINDSSYFEIYIDTLANYTSYQQIISEKSSLVSFQLLPNKKYYFKYRKTDKNFFPEPWSTSYTLFTFDPEAFHLELWLKPDTSVTINTSSEVISWIDKSSNNNLLIPSTTPPPLFRKNLPFETPSISFDGTSSFLIGDTINGLNNSSITFLSVSSGTLISNGLELGLFSINNWSNGFWLERGTSTQSFVNWSNGDFLRNASDLPDGGFNYKILGYKKDFGQQVSLSINGVSTCQSSNNALVNGFTNGPIQLGGHSFGNWRGNIGETMVFSTLLSDSVYSICHEYLKQKTFPKFDFGEDKYICSFPTTLYARRDYISSYVWNDLSIGDSLVINGPGEYFVNITDIFGQSYTDTIHFYQKTNNSPVSLLNTDSIKLCSGSFTSLYANNNLYNYYWSNGDTTNKIIVDTESWYKVTITNCSNDSILDSIYVKLVPLPTFDLGNDTIICEGESIYLENNNTSSGQSYLWSNGSSDFFLTISDSGNYWLETTTLEGCVYTDSISIQQDFTLSNLGLGPDTSLCAGNTISLVNGNQTGLSYQWSDNSTNNTLTINSSGQYWITATNANNCVVQDTINVTVVGQAPLAGFQNTIACENNLITFNDTSLALGGATITQWFWNFGDPSATNDTAIVDQPTYSYADTGSFTINLTVTTNVGCKQNITKNIYIYPKPIVDFTNVIACQNDTAFFNDAINPLGYPISNYHWNFGDASSGASNTDTNSDPFHIFSQNTTYQVQLIATNTQGCVDSITKLITVRDEVSADFNYTSACINIPINFTDNSIAPSPNTSNTRAWSFFPGTATGLSATKTFTSAGIFPVRLTVTGFNNCVSSVTKQIEVFLPPDADFTNATSCVLDSFQLTDVSLPINGAINSWQWKFAGNTFSTNQNPKYVLNISGNSNIFLKVSNDKGCVDSITKAVYANPLPDASFNLNPSTYLFNDSPISFTPNFSSAVSYFWNVSDGNTYSDPSLNLTFTNQGVYNVSLQLTDNLGCRNNSSQSFSVGVRNTDLGIIAARSTIDNDGFVGVEADLYNFGSTPITEFEILYELTGGGIMKETWNADTLPPSAVLLFKFSSKAFLTITERENAISCITIQTVNTKLDDNISNNENCAALNSNKQLVADPYPNPADGDVTLPIVLTEDQTIIISVYDYLGKLIADNLNYDGVTGLNFIKIPSAAYSSGTYTLKISISDNNYTRKLIKQGSSK